MLAAAQAHAKTLHSIVEPGPSGIYLSEDFSPGAARAARAFTKQERFSEGQQNSARIHQGGVEVAPSTPPAGILEPTRMSQLAPLTLVTALLLAGFCPAQSYCATAGKAFDTPRVSDVQLRPTSEGIEVEITTTAAVKVRQSQLIKPDRLVF